MAIDFPSSPSVGQQYTFAGVTYTFTTTGVWAMGGSPPVPSGTRLLMQQTTAPTGWTKISAYDDCALRIVSGTAGSSGTVPFSTLFARTAVDNYTLAIADIPSHQHPCNNDSSGQVGSQNYFNSGPGANYNNYTNPAGGGGAHAHGIDLRVKTVDVIIAGKD